jgi:hypothetical protein
MFASDMIGDLFGYYIENDFMSPSAEELRNAHEATFAKAQSAIMWHKHYLNHPALPVDYSLCESRTSPNQAFNIPIELSEDAHGKEY